MLRPLGLAMILAAASAASGQEPAPPPSPGPSPVFPVAVITAPASVPAGAPLVLFGDQSTTSGRLSWILISPKVPFEVWDQPEEPGSLFLVRQPTAGVTYRVALVAYGGGNPAFAFDFADIPVGQMPNPPPGPSPGPAPGPEPGPQPPPAPPSPVVAGPLDAVLAFSQDDPSTAQLRVSTVAAQLSALDCRWSVVATASPLYPAFAPFLPKSGVPAVLVIGDVGGVRKVVWTIEGPTRPADVVDAVKKLRGVK